MNIQLVRRINHTIFMENHHLLCKFNPCKLIGAFLLIYNKHNSFGKRTLYYIYIKFLVVVQPKVIDDGNGDQGTVQIVLVNC